MNRYLPRSKATFLAIAVLTVILGVLATYYLPVRFFYDAQTIINDYDNEKGFVGSYPVTMSFYEYTGLGSLPFPLVAFIQLIMLLWVIYKIGIPEHFASLNLRNILVYTMILMLAFYISMPSKEFLTFLFIGLIVGIFQKKRFSVTTTISMVFLLLIAFGLWFRLYYAILPVLTLMIFYASRIKIKQQVLAGLVTGFVVMIFISLSYGFLKGEFLSESTREALNAERLGKLATNSVINSPVKPDTWYGESFSILYGFISVNIPVNGLRHILKPQILLFIAWQLLFTLYLFWLFKNALKSKRKNSLEIWIFSLVFSYFILQGVFEPDLGSAVKHKIGILPLLYYILYYDDFRKNIPV
ncbi:MULTISPECIES: hypothetical protein [unclassified Leeuwenhoekiella]|uniref:hypothetical protein n=1 Tax=unclassified Leeuwenhoekiella TaxID=2615029 RepID=UPI000C37C591|nr:MULTISPECIES: hypothetical protein [unclassified Leeuwenhoekiella]MAW96010.1 hypothetical protein [Leeuwenhoekiella sp.]MBA80004.1 hypothetical protein [Leeuwenhoekiella sp.]|tara:strand:+ start:5904 stop:6971 length:1068 start_codon:yes stop_codon:yes gene_type:complete